MSGMLARLSQLGQTAATSRSAIGRSNSNTDEQSLQRYSYRGITDKRTHARVDLTSRTSVRYTSSMQTRTIELQLPLDTEEAGTLARRRVSHLASLDGLEPGALVKLMRSFPSLRTIYTAPEADLARIVGPVAAARIRWFLDAPLDSALARDTAPINLRDLKNTLSSAA